MPSIVYEDLRGITYTRSTGSAASNNLMIFCKHNRMHAHEKKKKIGGGGGGGETERMHIVKYFCCLQPVLLGE